MVLAIGDIAVKGDWGRFGEEREADRGEPRGEEEEAVMMLSAGVNCKNNNNK